MSSQDDTKNFHVFLRKRPGTCNEPSEDNFGYEQISFPDVQALAEGELLIKNMYLSVDPAMRCMMNESSGVDYAKSWNINETISGGGGVGEVLESNSSSFKKGDLVIAASFWPWKKYFAIQSDQVHAVPQVVSKLSPTLFLSAFGLTGLTAYLGVKEKANLAQGGQQTMVVSAAAGSTGSLAGQIAKAEGCGRVIGICGTDEKCKWLLDLGFDAAINYKTENVPSRLSETCPYGIDIYFDNVGGSISDDVIHKMNQNSHVVLCGQISKYNTDLPYPPPISEDIQTILSKRNITRERFLVLNYKDQFQTGVQKLIELYLSGKLKVKETVEDGLSNAGKAFLSVMTGGNIGKQLVKVV